MKNYFIRFFHEDFTIRGQQRKDPLFHKYYGVFSCSEVVIELQKFLSLDMVIRTCHDDELALLDLVTEVL